MPEAPLFVEITLLFVVLFVFGLAAYGCWECRCWEKAWRQMQARAGASTEGSGVHEIPTNVSSD